MASTPNDKSNEAGVSVDTPPKNRLDPQYDMEDDPVLKRKRDDQAVLAVRNLALDLCTQFGGGHGGSALGMAAIGVALWKYAMRYNPADPEWFDRDRFVLSNGRRFKKHPCHHVPIDRSIRACEYLLIHHEPPSGLRCLDYERA